MSAPRFNLNVIEVANPCALPWDEMTGDDRVRHCRACDKSVYNLSDMTRPEAERFLAEAQGEVCVKFYRRADGTVVTQDCALVRAAKKTKRALLYACCCVFALIDLVLFERVSNWLGLTGNQTSSCVTLGAISPSGGYPRSEPELVGPPYLPREPEFVGPPAPRADASR